MHIDQLTLKNFRNFESVDIPLNSKMNIVIGNNGSGKSSLLMGALTAASAFFLGIDYASPRSIKTDDVRHVAHEIKKVYQQVAVYPVKVSCEGIVNGGTCKWSRSLSGPKSNTTYAAAYWVGGLVGALDGAQLINECSVSGSITEKAGKGSIGGLIGELGKTAKITYSRSDVAVNVMADPRGGADVGGFIGKGNGKTDAETVIRNCYATGNVTGGAYTGGFAGGLWGLNIKNCYASGNVSQAAAAMASFVGTDASDQDYYYNEFGNLDVPEDYNDMMGGNLHEWVKRQWRLYHRPTTDKSDAYISKKKELENLGFDWSCEGRWDWDAKEATWLQNYNGIKAYVDANGCLPIGESSIPLTTSVNSEFWIAAQKAAIRNGMMNEDKQQMLASIGIIYGQFKRNDDWQENYNFVKAYYEQHKQLPVGVNSQQMSTGSLSGFWIGLQRKKLKDNTLSAERVSLLKEIGIEYGQLENSWNANYNAVKAFFDEHHHLPVQDASILLPSGIQSRNWITNQKKFLKAGTAPEDRVKLLNDIGIVAEADAPKPSRSKSVAAKKAAQTSSKPSRKVSKNPAEEWQECYDFVKRCLEESRTLPTGEKSTTMPNGMQTKSWIKQQRIALKESGLPADKVELLRAIGIVGNLMEQNWMRDYECIKAYVEEHHQLPVYKNSFELPDGGQSAQWIANRRTQMRNGTMPEERVKMLADIGIVYGSLADNWKESYNAIKAYLDEHGELPLKEASITLPTGSQSHWWIRNQTLMLHQGRQSEDKVKLLNEIGIV